MNDSEKIASQTIVVSAATIASRLFGLIREQTFAYFFGAGMAMDAFVAAFRIPNLLRDLFAEGALSQAFVPVFTDNLINRGKSAAFQVANLALSGLIIIISAVVLIGIIVSPWIVQLIAPGFEKIPGKIELTTTLTRIMFPFLLFIALAALSMGMANTLGNFAIPAAAPILFNLGMILAGFVVCPFFDPPILGMAIGVLLGGFGQWVVQLPTLKKAGYRPGYKIDFKDPELRRILLLMLPAILGLASTQINIFVNTQLASLLPEGSVSYLNYSFRLMHFPLGAFGIAVATVTLPRVARLAAANDRPGMLQAVASSLRLVFFLTIPSTIFLIVAGKSIIGLLYQHGQFTFLDTAATASALLFYSLGLFAYAAIRVVAQAFYAVGNTRQPVIIGAIAVAFNIGLNLLLMHPLGYRGLALATSLAAMVNLAGLFWSCERKLGKLDIQNLTDSFLKMLFASIISGTTIWFIPRLIPTSFTSEKLGLQFFTVIAFTVIFTACYGVTCKLFRIPEWDQLFDLLRRRRLPV